MRRRLPPKRPLASRRAHHRGSTASDCGASDEWAFGQSPGDGSMDQFDGRTRPLSRLRGGPNSRRAGLGAAGAPRRAGAPPDPAESGAGQSRRKFSASQALEIPRNAEGISDSAQLERLAAPESRPAEIRLAERDEAFRSLASRRERLTANEVARKWRRNGLKRLNPRPEVVWARNPRTYNIWYAGARLTIRDSASAASNRYWSHKKVG
jgi:hypothetical protein